MHTLTVHSEILTFGKMLLSLSALTGHQYIILKNPNQYLEKEEEEEDEDEEEEEEDLIQVRILIFG